MKDGIGEGFTREDHSEVSNQIFAAYSKVQDVIALAQVIGEEELSELDKNYMEFGRVFENRFLKQDYDENREMEETLDLAWQVLGILPRKELDRVSPDILNKYYKAMER